MQAVMVAKWRHHDIVLESGTSKNPLSFHCTGTFTGPNGETITIPGFFGGDGRWIIRFSPWVEGEWVYSIQSEGEPSLIESGALTCIPNANPLVRGSLTIDAANPQRFAYEDGTPCFLLAFECDWLFALEPHAARHIIDDIASNGFNKVVMNVYAHDVQWGGEGQGTPDDYGPPNAYVFGGTNDGPDHTVLNTSFFDNLDTVVEYLREKGISAHIMIYVWNKGVNWPALGSAEDDNYLDYVVARYQAFCNVVWDVSKEALLYGHCDADYISGRIERLRRADGYKRLLTVHDSKYCSIHPELVDFFSIQHWGTDLYRVMHDLVLGHPDMPVFNIEHGGYERGPYKTFIGDYQDPIICLKRNYECAFAGTYSTYYWQDASWDIVVWDRSGLPEADRPRYEYFRHMQDYFSEVGFQNLVPVSGKSSSGLCLAEPGVQYLFFLPEGESIHANAEDGDYLVEWFNTLTGERIVKGVQKSRNWWGNESPWGAVPCVLRLVRDGGGVRHG